MAEGGNKRGLASSDPETVQRVAKSGGYALHKVRGLQAAPKKVRREVARLGGLARQAQRRKEREEEEEEDAESGNVGSGIIDTFPAPAK